MTSYDLMLNYDLRYYGVLWGYPNIWMLYLLYFMENPNFESGQLNWGYHFSYHGLRKPTDQSDQLPSLEIPMIKVTANNPPHRPRNSV